MMLEKFTVSNSKAARPKSNLNSRQANFKKGRLQAASVKFAGKSVFLLPNLRRNPHHWPIHAVQPTPLEAYTDRIIAIVERPRRHFGAALLQAVPFATLAAYI
jgi:hypothetical protein